MAAAKKSAARKAPAKKAGARATKPRDPNAPKIGRPKKYPTPESFMQAVDDFVTRCKLSDPPRPVTWSGLALGMGFHGRRELDGYGEYDGYKRAYDYARTVVECAYEERLCGPNATGSIFALKNMGWRDTQDINANMSLTINANFDG